MIDRTVLVGHYEYDSTGYIAEHVTPLIGLAEHATDESVRTKAGKALALLFADMAVEYFHGAWAGGHSREGYRVNTWTKSGTVRGLYFLYFGGEDHDPAAHDQAFVAPNLAADYLPPPMLRDIAFDRAKPFVVKKTRAPRAVYRHVDREPAPVRKYTYMSRSFALGTTQLDLPGAPAGPIDLTSWDLSWEAPKHQGKITCNHPYTDPRRFSAFLPVVPQAAGRDIATDKPYLQWQDRLFGASPFERMMQHEATALVLYRLPADDRNPYLNIYLPKALTWHEQAGWLFADAGPFYIALRVVGAYGWEEIRESVHANIMVRDGDLIDGWLLRVDARLGGLAVECVEAEWVDSFAAYRDQRCAADVALGRWRSEAVVAIDTWDGHHLQLDYHGEHRVDGQPIDYDAYPLLSAPWVDAPLGSGRVRFARGEQTVELDFGIDATTELIPMRVIG